MLKIVPDDQYDWQPHPKSMTVRQLATHIAELPSWIPLAINTDVLDFSANDYKPTPISKNSELLATFEEIRKKLKKLYPKLQTSTFKIFGR